jgi:Glycosyl hydrolase family 71
MLRASAFTLFALLATISKTNCKDVFAHVIVGNNGAYTETDWYNDIKAAASALIDGFALDIGNDTFTDSQLDNAYSAAESYGNDFQLFLSFDYGAVPDYDAYTIIRRINAHSGSPAQYNYTAGKPLASTFEGWQHAGDWANIKAQTNCFFIPDYSSQGPTGAAAEPNVDGLLSWDAWPTGPNDMTNSTDIAYVNALAGKPYMMPVSPWFYTNLPAVSIQLYV